MSRTVCPWCKAPLVLKDDILVCSNTDCPACDEKYLHEELIRTRKALVVAVNAIETIKYSKKSDAINLRHKANKALIEIHKIKT